MRAIFFSFLGLVASVSCSFGQKVTESAYGFWQGGTDNPLISKQDVYRHYEGTIGWQHAALDMRFGVARASNYGGSTGYIAGPCQLFSLIATETGSFFDRAIELPGGDYARSWPGIVPPKWLLSVNADSMVGMRATDNGANGSRIELREDYTTAYRMDVMRYNDSTLVGVVEGKPNMARGVVIAVTPAAGVSAADGDFIKTAMLKALQEPGMKCSSWEEYPKAKVEKYLTDIQAGVENVLAEMPKNGKLNLSYYAQTFPVYNEDGILVMEMMQNSVHALGYQQYRDHLCLDVRNKKVLHLDDVLDVDKAALSALLTVEAREQDVAGKPNRKYKNQLIPPSDDIIITSCGLRFCYNAGQIANGPDSEMSIFLTYKQVSSMLKKDFRTRVGL